MALEINIPLFCISNIESRDHDNNLFLRFIQRGGYLSLFPVGGSTSFIPPGSRTARQICILPSYFPQISLRICHLRQAVNLLHRWSYNSKNVLWFYAKRNRSMKI